MCLSKSITGHIKCFNAMIHRTFLKDYDIEEIKRCVTISVNLVNKFKAEPNKYISKPGMNKIKSEIKNKFIAHRDEVERLEKEAKDLYQRGLYYHYEKKKGLIRQLKSGFKLKDIQKWFNKNV